MNTGDIVGIACLAVIFLPWFVYAMRQAFLGKLDD